MINTINVRAQSGSKHFIPVHNEDVKNTSDIACGNFQILLANWLHSS